MSDPRTYGLTPRCLDLLRFLRAHIDVEGHPPTYREMADYLGLGSPSGIHRLVGELEERGLVRRLPRKPQTLALVEPATISLPDDVDGMLRAAARAHGRSPSEHAAALIRHHCPPLQPF